LEAAVRGELPDEDMGELIAHLVDCHDCRKRLVDAVDQVQREGGVQ
jgi:anti-sigma factor RsiW